MKNKHVMIAGAGPAGLTLGLVLQQRGISFTIVDGSPEDVLCADVGGGYDLGPNAIKTYERFGLGSLLKERGSRFKILHTLTNKRRLSNSIRIPDEVEMASVRRSTLQNILLEKLTTRNMVLGSCVTGVAESSDRISITLENGETISGDILIGADGVHSTVRQSLLGDGEATHVGVNCLWGRLRWNKLPAADRQQFDGACMMSGDGQSFIAGHMDNQLIWSTFWLANTFVAAGSKHLARQQAVDRLTPWNKQIAGIVERSDLLTISETGIYDRPAAKTWHSHRTLLIGDAAHPMTPFSGAGANTAIADACLLGQLIDGLQSPDEVFRFFEHRRKKPVERVVRNARTVCDYFVTKSKWKNLLMHYGMSVIPSTLMVKMLLASDNVNNAFTTACSTRTCQEKPIPAQK